MSHFDNLNKKCIHVQQSSFKISLKKFKGALNTGNFVHRKPSNLVTSTFSSELFSGIYPKHIFWSKKIVLKIEWFDKMVNYLETIFNIVNKRSLRFQIFLIYTDSSKKSGVLMIITCPNLHHSQGGGGGLEICHTNFTSTYFFNYF